MSHTNFGPAGPNGVGFDPSRLQTPSIANEASHFGSRTISLASELSPPPVVTMLGSHDQFMDSIDEGKRESFEEINECSALARLLLGSLDQLAKSCPNSENAREIGFCVSSVSLVVDVLGRLVDRDLETREKRPALNLESCLPHLSEQERGQPRLLSVPSIVPVSLSTELARSSEGANPVGAGFRLDGSPTSTDFGVPEMTERATSCWGEAARRQITGWAQKLREGEFGFSANDVGMVESMFAELVSGPTVNDVLAVWRELYPNARSGGPEGIVRILGGLKSTVVSPRGEGSHLSGHVPAGEQRINTVGNQREAELGRLVLHRLSALSREKLLSMLVEKAKDSQNPMGRLCVCVVQIYLALSSDRKEGDAEPKDDTTNRSLGPQLCEGVHEVLKSLGPAPSSNLRSLELSFTAPEGAASDEAYSPLQFHSALVFLAKIGLVELREDSGSVGLAGVVDSRRAITAALRSCSQLDRIAQSDPARILLETFSPGCHYFAGREAEPKREVLEPKREVVVTAYDGPLNLPPSMVQCDSPVYSVRDMLGIRQELVKARPELDAIYSRPTTPTPKNQSVANENHDRDSRVLARE